MITSVSAAGGQYDYGKSGRIGVATPQANPTVEAEFSILYPRSVSIQATRLTSASVSPEARLKAYIANLDSTLKTYASLPLDAFGFACTGSSYLVGSDYEDDLINHLTDQMNYPVTTAALSILDWLETQNFKTIGVVMPYPDPIIEAAITYWNSRNVKVAHVVKLKTSRADTTSIYDLSSTDSTHGLNALDTKKCDAILLSGTGMPTLASLLNSPIKVPVVSSNYCLAWQLLKLAEAKDILTPDGLHIVEWQKRFLETMK